jgi:purine-nucleoside phosphorylase
VSDLLARLDEAASAVRAQAPGFVADLGLVLGSGLSGAVRLLEAPLALPLASLPHLRAPTVSGHPGQLVLGRVGRLQVAVLAGRLHPYEGWSAEETVFPVRLLLHLGAPVLVLTNAAGAVRPDLRRGDWMVVRDHLNLSGLNPLRGPNDVRLGPRFPDLSAAYDPGLRAQLAGAAVEAGVGLAEGVYAMMGGPSYETPAEIQMLRTLGADAVGMSTVLEVIAAVHMGARVACLSCITNAAAGVGPGILSHAEVEAAAREAEEDGVRLLRAFLARLGGPP